VLKLGKEKKNQSDTHYGTLHSRMWETPDAVHIHRDVLALGPIAAPVTDAVAFGEGGGSGSTPYSC